MHNPRLAGRYAKSLIDIAVERNELETVRKDMDYMRALIKASPEFASLLRSPVIPVDTKSKAVAAVVKGNLSQLTAAFSQLLISKNREFFLPEIVEAFIEQYNQMKGIHKVKLTTAAEVSDDVKKAIVKNIHFTNAADTVQLETVVNEDLIGGFVLEYNNNLIDASIARDLNDIRKQFSENSYQHQLR